MSLHVLLSVDYLGNDCRGSNCPTIYQDESDYLVIQGANAMNEMDGFDVPDNELAIRVPKSLIARYVSEGYL